MALELSRPEQRSLPRRDVLQQRRDAHDDLRMTIADYVDMQEGRQNGQQLVHAGPHQVEGDMAFLMQVASLNM